MPNYRYSTPEYMRRNNSMSRQSSCYCDRTITRSSSYSDMPIAMAYIPWQEWHDIYDVEKGLHCGTIFEELYKPFQGMGGCS